MSNTINIYTRVIGTIMMTLVFMVGFFIQSAHASTDVTIEERLFSSTQMVLSAVNERIATDEALLSNTVSNDAQIAALTILLQQLIEMYEKLLAAQGDQAVINENTSDTYPVKLIRKGNIYVDDNGGTFLELAMKGYSQNKSIFKWELRISCESAVTILGKNDEELCGTVMPLYRSNYYDVTKDQTLLTVGVSVLKEVQQKASFGLTAFSSDGKVLGSDTYTLALSGGGDNTTTRPVISISPNSPSIKIGETVKFTWSITPTSGTTCQAAGNGIGGAESVALSGSWTTPQLYADTTYGVRCTNDAGTSYKYINVDVEQVAAVTKPNINISPDYPYISQGETVDFNWTITPTSGTSCTASGEGLNGEESVALSGSWTTPELYSSTSYKITCVNDGGTTYRTIYVGVI